MPWLIMTWWLLLGPVSGEQVIQQPGAISVVRELPTPTFEAEIGIQAVLWKHVAARVSVRSYEVPVLPYFAPFQVDYTIGAGLIFPYVEFWIQHECDHPVVWTVTGANPQNAYAQFRTDLFIKFSARVARRMLPAGYRMIVRRRWNIEREIGEPATGKPRADCSFRIPKRDAELVVSPDLMFFSPRGSYKMVCMNCGTTYVPNWIGYSNPCYCPQCTEYLGYGGYRKAAYVAEGKIGTISGNNPYAVGKAAMITAHVRGGGGWVEAEFIWRGGNTTTAIYAGKYPELEGIELPPPIIRGGHYLGELMPGFGLYEG